MLERIDELIDDGTSFAFETTLSTKSYKKKLLEAQTKGYVVSLLFFWLQSPELAVERVRIRVAEGGHNIEQEIIKRRYNRGIKNLFDLYLPIVNGALIFDNSEGIYELIAEKMVDAKLNIINQNKYNKIRDYYDNY